MDRQLSPSWTTLCVASVHRQISTLPKAGISRFQVPLFNKAGEVKPRVWSISRPRVAGPLVPEQICPLVHKVSHTLIEMWLRKTNEAEASCANHSCVTPNSVRRRQHHQSSLKRLSRVEKRHQFFSIIPYLPMS